MWPTWVCLRIGPWAHCFIIFRHTHHSYSCKNIPWYSHKVHNSSYDMVTISDISIISQVFRPRQTAARHLVCFRRFCCRLLMERYSRLLGDAATVPQVAWWNSPNKNCHQNAGNHWKSLRMDDTEAKTWKKNAKNRRFNQQKFGVRILTNIGWRVNVRKTPQMCGRQPASAVKCPSVHWPSQCHISGELPSWKYTYQPLPKPQGDLGIKSSIKFTGLPPVPWEEKSKPQKLGSNLPQASIFGVGWRNFLKLSKSHSIRRAPDSSAPPLASKYVGNWSRCCATTVRR